MSDITVIYYDSNGDEMRFHLEERIPAEVSLPAQAAAFTELSKERLFVMLHKAYEEGVCTVLYDTKMRTIDERVHSLGICRFDEAAQKAPELPEGSCALFFTSGTTGEPVGALKSRSNIECELDALEELFAPYDFERVIVTVPLIHIYGYIGGVMLPRRLGCEVVFKEEYWPYDLLSLHEGKKTLCVTNPVYIKSMLKLKRGSDLSNVIFLSSTGLLLSEEVAAFEAKYRTTLLQLFGSTETGGIALKKGTDTTWMPLCDVLVGIRDGVMEVASPYISEYLFESEIRPLKHPFSTTDIIEQNERGFVLLGRKSEIVKISGKRLSLVELEHLLEQELPVDEVLITLKRDSSRLKDEYIHIDMVECCSDEAIREVFKQYYPAIHFEFETASVEGIPKNKMGKKLRR